MTNESEKILVRYFSNVLEKEVVETLWAETIDTEKGLYKIDNIPFYGPQFSCGDIVYAEYDDYEERLTFRKVVEYSGNSTIQIVILDQSINGEGLRSEFKNLGCESEGTGSNYFVLEIPYDINYSNIFLRLSKLEDGRKIEFAEPLISEKHSAEK